MGNCCFFYRKKNNHSILNHSNRQTGSFRVDNIEKERMFSKLVTSMNKQPMQYASIDKKHPFVIFGQTKKAKNFCLFFNPLDNTFKQEKIEGINFLNYCGTIFLDSNRLMVCGGIKHDLRDISNQSLIIDFKKLSVSQKPNMNQIRYTFPLVKKYNYVYAIGGRVYGSDQVSLLKKCERYSIEFNTWEPIADMNVTRCTSTALLFQNQVYVIGGYTQQYKRSKKVERYSEVNNTWEVIDFQLYQGFENGNVVASPYPNKILILGGKLNYGDSKYVWEYDLIEKTVLIKKPLINKGILTKYTHDNEGRVFIFGQDEEKKITFNCYIEEYDIHNYENKIIANIDLKNKDLEKMKQYNFTFKNIEIAYVEQEPYDYSQRDYEDINLLFGTDVEPFQLEVNSKTAFVNIVPIPIDLELKNFQGAARISNDQLLFAGGINIKFKIIYEKSFIYNLSTREVIPVPNMKDLRYTFPLIKHKEFVYAIGGRQYGNDQSGIINQCERFNLETKQWQRIGFLNKPRCTANAFIYKDKLLVAGGFCQNSKRTNTIEIFNEESLEWFAVGLELPYPLEASFTINQDDNLIFFGGRQDKKGDTPQIFKLDFKDNDFSEPQILKVKMKEAVCLHNGFNIGNNIVLFGCKVNYIQFFDKDSLQDKDESKNCLVTDLPLSVIKQRLLQSFQKISYNKEYFKKNSYINIE